MTKNDNKNIKALLNMTEVSLNRKMKSTSDFEFLSNSIEMRCRTKLSVSTLKRLWSYTAHEHTPYFSTLSILAIFIGYKNFDDFVANKGIKSPTSFSYTAFSLSSKDMQQGDLLWIAWPPNRNCLLSYQGDNLYKVAQTQNTKLQVGDSFTSLYFAEGLPLYLDDYIHKDNPPVTFVIGYSGGLSSIKRIKSDTREELP
ncbi:MAG: hypothetical protein II865_11180 [Bacteroidales bacterium]|jgi:hypothetical protein|nr:hypothetical protein [Bacteroidales bacterium]